MGKMKEFWLIFFLTSLLRDINGQVTPPPPTIVAIGDDVSLTCTSTESNPRFIWTFISDDILSQTLFLGDEDTAGPIRYNNIVLRSSPNVQTSVLGIDAIELEDEGGYQCSTTTATVSPPPTLVTVEVGSASQPISLDCPPNYTEYIATCNAIGSKPGENITWILDGVIQTEEIAQTGPTERDDSLFDTTSVFTFPAKIENYNATLKCVIGGHQVEKLNRNETRLVDIHNPPEAEGITIGLNSERTGLIVSCNINSAVDAAIPPMESFYIYSNGTLVTKPASANSVTVPEPDYETEYMCVGGNYLGNTSATEIFYPGRTTTPTPPTAPNTTQPNAADGGSTEPGSVSGLGAGAIAGIAVGAIIFIALIIVLIVVFVVKPDCIGGSGSPNTTTTHKHSTSAVGSSNGNEKEKIRPEAAPRGHSSIKHTTDNPQQAEYAMVDRRPGGRGDSTDARGNGAGQNEQPGMHYADLDLTSSAGHSDRVVPKNEDGVVVYSSILV